MSTPLQPSSRSRWPEPGQFNEAVQNLATTMSDRELQGGEAEVNAMGMPSPYAGNFADVYKVHCPQTGNTWAVKFFKREVRDLRERYRAISEQLIIAQLPFMTEFRYIEDGVRIGGTWYPLVKMRWIEGQSLSRFVAQSLFQPKLLDLLFELWVKLATRLRGAGIAHADLQHGNVVLVPHGDQGKLLLKLIDYDGMFVPALAGQAASELGHPNYQHPTREVTRAYNPELDRFSHLAICTALRCLSVGGLPLWERFNTDDNVLFTSRDFADPANSKLFRELWMLRNRDAHALVGHLALATQRPLELAPLLDDLVRDGQIRPLTAAEQQDVDALLSATEGATTTVPVSAPPVVSAIGPPPVAAAIAAAVPVAEVAAPPAPEEPVEATLAPSFSVLALAALPFLLLDRLLGLLAGGAQNALLHNFFRVVAVGVAVGGPVALYASGYWRQKAPPVSPPIASLSEETVEPEEENPPEPEPDPDTESPPEPAKDPFVIESETPDPTPKPMPVVKPMPPKPTPAVARQRPFEELERSSDGLALLKLPTYTEGSVPTPVALAQLRIDRPEDLELKLFGAAEVFSLARRVELESNDAALSPGKLRSWILTRSRSETGLPAAKERIGEFFLGGDHQLSFAWEASSLTKSLGALRYCLLELKVPTESVVCALSAPVEIVLPAWSFNEISGIASLPIPDLDTITLPPTDKLLIDLSLGAGRRTSTDRFHPEVRREASSPGSELSSSSAKFAFADKGTTLFEVKAALSLDPQASGSARLVMAPEFIKNIYKPEGFTTESTPASATRLAKLRQDCEAEIKRIAGKRDSRKRLIEAEKWNQQLILAQDKYALADEAMLNAQTPSALAAAERRVESANREVERFQKLIDERAVEDQQSFELQSFAEDNRDRCDRALAGMNQLQQTALAMRLYYEVDVNSTRRQIDIIRTAGIPTPKKTPSPSRSKGKARP